MSSIRYILELLSPVSALANGAVNASISTVQNGNLISKLTIGRPEGETYWTRWGGNYNGTIQSETVQFFIKQFLQKVTSQASLLATVNSFFVDAPIIYLNTSMYLWQYFFSDIEVTGAGDELKGGYSSAARSITAQKNSDDFYYHQGGSGVRYPAKLRPPTGLLKKLPNPIYGVTLSSSFSVNIENGDGEFDFENNPKQYINEPIKLKRSDINDPLLENFETIRSGFFDDIIPGDETALINASDKYKTFNEQVCNIFTDADYPGINTSLINKPIPVGWGNITVDLIEISSGQYIAVDPDYLTSVSAVYNSDGNSISFTVLSGIISASGAKTADIAARTENRIGQIVVSEITNKSAIPYIAENWDITEADQYQSASSEIAYYFSGGTVKSLIAEVQKSDSAFLIEKNDGRLTLRKWGNIYGAHIIESWRHTQKSKGKYQDSKWFLTSIAINYDVDKTYIDASMEDALNEEYKTTVLQTFDTHLTTSASAASLATVLYNRFGRRAEVWEVSVAYNTAGINLLDNVTLSIVHNDRVKSNNTSWIVVGVDPAQDKLILEEA